MLSNICLVLADVDAWRIADNAVAFVFSLFTTAALTYLTWKIINNFLDLFLGKGVAFLGATFSAILVLSAGLKTSGNFLVQAQSIYILQGFISGIVDTVNVCIAPRLVSPIEFIVIVSFGLYICYWLHTRFLAKQGGWEIRRKIDHAIGEEGAKDPQYPY